MAGRLLSFDKGTVERGCHSQKFSQSTRSVSWIATTPFSPIAIRMFGRPSTQYTRTLCPNRTRREAPKPKLAKNELFAKAFNVS